MPPHAQLEKGLDRKLPHGRSAAPDLGLPAPRLRESWFLLLKPQPWRSSSLP